MNSIIKSESNSIVVQTIDQSILAGQCSEQTLKLYKESWDSYVQFAGSAGNALNEQTLIQWRDMMVTETKLSPNSINRHLSAVKRVVKEAATKKYVSLEVAALFKAVDGVKVKALKDRKKVNARVRISKEQMAALVNSPDVSTLSGKMHHALLMTLATTGLRISECVGLKVNQIVKVGRGYQLVNIYGKNKVEGSDVAIANSAVAAIQTWLKARTIESEFIFTGFEAGRKNVERSTAIHPVSAWELVVRYSTKVGLEGVKPHDFRRFVGTQLAATKGIKKAQNQLRHESSRTTLDNYVLVEIDEDLVEGLF